MTTHRPRSAPPRTRRRRRPVRGCARDRARRRAAAALPGDAVRRRLAPAAIARSAKPAGSACTGRRELGGRGLTSLDTLACEERFGYHWLPLSGYLLSVKTIGNALLRFASPELQRRLIPEIAAGRIALLPGVLRARRRLGPRLAANAAPAVTATASSSAAARSGPPAPSTPTGSTSPSAPTPTASATAASRCSSRRLDSPGITVLSHRHARRRHDRRARARRRRDPSRPARRGAARRLAGADGHARLRARDEREGRDGDMAAGRAVLRSCATTATRRALSAAARGRGGRARLHGRRAAEAARAGPAGERPELDGEARGRRADAGVARSRSTCSAPRRCWRRAPARCAAGRRLSARFGRDHDLGRRRRDPAHRDRPARARSARCDELARRSQPAAAGRRAGARVRPVRGRPVRRHAARRPRRRGDQGRAAQRRRLAPLRAI